ncbi:MAG: HPr family phosphocarrier protein [Pseudomonadota bacterium]
MSTRLQSTLTIVNRKGLHARASAKFVECVEEYNALAWVSRDGQTVRGDSIMGLLTLGAAQGTTVDVLCEGADASVLMDALEKLLSDRFGEDA